MKYPIKVIQKNNELKALPRNTKEVSLIMKFCNKKKINIIPLGCETNKVKRTKGQFKNLSKISNLNEAAKNLYHFIFLADKHKNYKTISISYELLQTQRSIKF